MSAAQRIIESALTARTVADARKVNELIAAAVGARYERPVGDRVNNFGLLTTSGSYDFKLIENVTNMLDALLERAAAERHGSRARAFTHASPRLRRVSRRNRRCFHPDSVAFAGLAP